MECKIWKGKEEFDRAFEQLFSYLTWRHNFGIIVTFNKNNKDFSDVLQKAREYTKSHPSYIQNGLTEENSTHFITQHTHPTDAGKRIEIHSLLFNLFYE